MRNFFKTVIFSLLIMSCNNYNSTTKKELRGPVIKTQTPPMGWNSWNSLDFRATEVDIKNVADYMSENLLEYGWEYVVIDAGWYYPPEITCNDGKMDDIPQNIDEYGRLVPDVIKYPSSANNKGFKELADYIHSKGLKFGIHIMRGIPWNAAASNLRLKGSDYKASEIADTENTCEWNASMYGIIDYKSAKAYYRSLIELYNDWGVDFIKADDMIRPLYEHELNGLADAIIEINPNIILSLSPGKADIADAQKLSKNSEMWRVSNDFSDDWEYVVPMFQLLKDWTPYRSYGKWPDADMLPFGKLRKNGRHECVASLLKDEPGNIIDEYSRLTPDEMYTVMTLWIISKSQLMLGGYFPEYDELTNKLITNKKAIKVNQLSKSSKEVYNRDNIVVWKAFGVDSQETTFLAVFNLSDKNREIKIKLEELGYGNDLFRAQDIWQNKNLGILLYAVDFEINGHGASFFELVKENSAMK
jgi:alpha-galactosidase